MPTGYSFNLDGTAIYLTMASLFIADAMARRSSIGEQISLLVFMIIASKGAAGVTGAGLATLAGGLSSHRPELLDGVGLIVGIDRFMSEARAVTNFAGNAVATVLVGPWTGTLDREPARPRARRRRPVRRDHDARRRPRLHPDAGCSPNGAGARRSLTARRRAPGPGPGRGGRTPGRRRRADIGPVRRVALTRRASRRRRTNVRASYGDGRAQDRRAPSPV